jgi:hypothetical protein
MVVLSIRLPSITVSSIKLDERNMLVTIMSNGDISGLAWNFQTEEITYKPTLIIVSENNHIAQMIFPLAIWGLLRLKKSSPRTNYRGYDLVAYLSTRETFAIPNQPEFHPQENLFLSILGIGALAIGGLILWAKNKRETNKKRTSDGRDDNHNELVRK